MNSWSSTLCTMIYLLKQWFNADSIMTYKLGKFYFYHLVDLFITGNKRVQQNKEQSVREMYILHFVTRSIQWQLAIPKTVRHFSHGATCWSGASQEQTKASCQFPAGLLSSLKILIPNHRPSSLDILAFCLLQLAGSINKWAARERERERGQGVCKKPQREWIC